MTAPTRRCRPTRPTWWLPGALLMTAGLAALKDRVRSAHPAT